ncbi:MAG: hypothetical protein ACPL3C_02130 [Pyrobaculum sp.]|uniref:hypothetical protein n=1 Tax=Pyrobaculum sp. TaxID=2004705 RepID=UPI003C934762
MLFAFGQRRRLAHRLQYLDLGLLSFLLYEIAGGIGMNFAVGLSAGGLRVPILEKGFVAYLQKKKLDESGEWSVETEDLFTADLASLLVV